MHEHHTLHKSITASSYHMLERETRRSSTLWLPKFSRRNPMRGRQRTRQHAVYRCRRGLCLWILGLLLPLLAQAEQFSGKVVGIRAGDTLSVLRDGRVV